MTMRTNETQPAAIDLRGSRDWNGRCVEVYVMQTQCSRCADFHPLLLAYDVTGGGAELVVRIHPEPATFPDAAADLVLWFGEVAAVVRVLGARPSSPRVKVAN